MKDFHWPVATLKTTTNQVHISWHAEHGTLRYYIVILIKLIVDVHRLALIYQNAVSVGMNDLFLQSSKLFTSRFRHESRLKEL